MDPVTTLPKQVLIVLLDQGEDLYLQTPSYKGQSPRPSINMLVVMVVFIW